MRMNKKLLAGQRKAQNLILTFSQNLKCVFYKALIKPGYLFFSFLTKQTENRRE